MSLQHLNPKDALNKSMQDHADRLKHMAFIMPGLQGPHCIGWTSYQKHTTKDRCLNNRKGGCNRDAHLQALIISFSMQVAAAQAAAAQAASEQNRLHEDYADQLLGLEVCSS